MQTPQCYFVHSEGDPRKVKDDPMSVWFVYLWDRWMHGRREEGGRESERKLI